MCIMLCTISSRVTAKKYKDSKISHIKPAPLHFTAEKMMELPHRVLNNDKFADKQFDKQSNQEPKKKFVSNHEILKSLGLSKLKIPPSHHRKRLAIESRHHGRPDDSHMFIIKLPPNPVYYTNSKSTDDRHNSNSIHDNNKKVSVDFRSNGKPGRIYHWNLPIMKKIFAHETRDTHLRHSNDISELIDIKTIPTWTKPWENETFDKESDNDDKENENYLKKKSPSYYVPARPKKSNMHKYFPGNGKPKGFYVIEKNQHKPYYQKLIP